MKQLLILLMVCFVGVGCRHNNDNVVTSKFYTQDGKNLPPCICLYYYNQGFTFHDSCNKYSVLDTIK